MRDLKLKAQFDKIKVKAKEGRAGFLGNHLGVVKASDDADVYVTLYNGEVIVVKNTKVPNIPKLPVIIGSMPESTLLQVLHSREVYESTPYPTVPAHAEKTHQWPGYDTLWIQGEQFLPGLVFLKSALVLTLVEFVYFLNGWRQLKTQDIDMSPYIPTFGAKQILIETDSAGTLSYVEGVVKGSRELLLVSDIPLVSSVTKKPLVAVKVYAGQATILKTRFFTDITDLRWSGYSTSAGVASSVNWSDLIDVPVTFPPDLTITDPLYVRKFDSLVDPTVNDDITIGYLKNDLWHNTASRSYFLCHDNADGAADWFPLGQGGGGFTFAVDGTLAVLASSASNVIVFTKDTVIEDWYFHIEGKGSIGTTILDVHYLIGGSGSIFTTQANRPSIAFDAASNLMIATPDITQFFAGDVIELQIDQVATGAISLVLVGNVTGSNGASSSSAVTVTDGIATPIAVGNIVFDGATVTDDGGGQATIQATKWTHDGTLIYSNSNWIPNVYTDLDLSGIVGLRHALVYIKVVVTYTSDFACGVSFRTKGDIYPVYAWNVGQGAIGGGFAANTQAYVVVETDENGIIQWANDGTLNTDKANLYLMGYI
jgi:hypothetical protein